MQEDKRIELMKNGDVKKAVLKMGIPVTLGMMFMVLYNICDTYFIGMLNNDYMLAAVNYSYPLLMIMIAISGIVGNGASSYIARCLGKKDFDEANHTLTIGFRMIVSISIVMTVLGLVFINPLVNLLGASELSFAYTKDYVLVLILGSIFTMSNYALGQLLRSEGSVKISMAGMIAGTVTNMILDPVFIFTLKMNVMGAAIATVIGNIVATVIYLVYYARKKSILRPDIKFIKYDKNIVKEIMYVGIPHTFEQVFLSIAVIICNNLSSSYGDQYVAAMGIANKIMTFGQYIYQGMAAGNQALYGYNYGAKKYDRLKKIIMWSIIETVLILLGVMVIFFFFSDVLVSQFTKSSEVTEIGAMTLRAFMLYLPTAAIISIVRNVFNSIGKPFYAFFITAVRQLAIYVPALILLNKFFEYNGLIYAQVLSEFVCMIMVIPLIYSVINKEMKK